MAVTPEYVRKDLVEHLLGYYGAMLTWSKEDVLSQIKRGIQKNSTSKDLVEVVRCKDCKHKETLTDAITKETSTICLVGEPLYFVEDNDYCSKGERKCDNGKQ